MFRKLMSGAIALSLVAAFAALVGGPASAATSPSGQRMTAQTSFDAVSGQFIGGGGSVEPAYDDVTGTIIYLWTPNKAKVHPNAHNVAPLYLPVYPTGVGIDPASLNCAHVPADNCANHGVGVAGAAQQIMPERLRRRRRRPRPPCRSRIERRRLQRHLGTDPRAVHEQGRGHAAHHDRCSGG